MGLKSPPVDLIKSAPLLDKIALSSAFKASSKRLLISDFDGTMTPIVNDPDAAVPTAILLESLTNIAADERNHVWIVSGRDRTFLQKHFGHIRNLGLNAEHGCFTRRPGSTEWLNLTTAMDMGWKVAVEDEFEQLVAKHPGSRIERKEVAMVWHYRNAADYDACFLEASDSKARLESKTLKDWDVDVMLGKANLEVRPRLLNKGSITTKLVKEIFCQDQNGFVFCAGDDTTDEDMFQALLTSPLPKESIFTCLVSKKEQKSLANYRAGDPTEVVDIISFLSTYDGHDLCQRCS